MIIEDLITMISIDAKHINVPKGIDDDLLGFSDTDDLRLLNGEPYTGFSHLLHPNGKIAGSFYYEQGLEIGLQREWYDNGQIENEVNFVGKGLGRLEMREWYTNGQIKRHIQSDVILDTRIKEWDENGNLIRDETNTPTPQQQKTINEMKRLRGLPID